VTGDVYGHTSHDPAHSAIDTLGGRLGPVPTKATMGVMKAVDTTAGYQSAGTEAASDIGRVDRI
jgi:hypothetical protein